MTSRTLSTDLSGSFYWCQITRTSFWSNGLTIWFHWLNPDLMMMCNKVFPVAGLVINHLEPFYEIQITQNQCLGYTRSHVSARKTFTIVRVWLAVSLIMFKAHDYNAQNKGVYNMFNNRSTCWWTQIQLDWNLSHCLHKFTLISNSSDCIRELFDVPHQKMISWFINAVWSWGRSCPADTCPSPAHPRPFDLVIDEPCGLKRSAQAQGICKIFCSFG